MELRHLLTFKAIVEQGGFKNAAEHLGYAQSSVTVHIKELEEELGKPLFDRLGRKVFLTNYGTRFLPYTTKIIDLHNEAIESINLDEVPRGNLVIGVSELITQYRIPSLFMEYKKRYPNVSLSLKSLESEDISSAIRNGKIDLALVLEKSDWFEKELHIEKIKDELIVLISPIDNKSTSDTILFTEEGCSYKSMFENYLREKRIEVKDTLSFSSLEAIKQCVMYGIGISMLPYFSVKEELDSQKINGQFMKLNETENSTFLVYHKNKQLSLAIQSMISLIKDHSLLWN
ncbi:LysR family transcriptional regulator [Paenibacillus polymyxa]|uniref:LysR family transcriptional regulator n=1 Tax=Paenibacillus polymyxa TaxID=1406 RepID=UPI00234AE803|nr:LysR family transcriptional regulator [Paenibacillus polymyxa]WCM60728.1 LysR family transcriptional regulator [Paenibacillus polymyxa]